MMPSIRPLFSALGSRKYMSAVPCNTNQCLCQSLVGLCFISQPFFRFKSSCGDGIGICGTVTLALSGVDEIGVVCSDTSRPHPSGTPRTGSSGGGGLDPVSPLWGETGGELEGELSSVSVWGESIWITGCWGGEAGGWTGVEVAKGAGEGEEGDEGLEYFTEDEDTLAENRGVGGNSALTSREDFLGL